MNRAIRALQQTLILAAIAVPLSGQQVQFKASVKMKTSDGNAATGTMYFSGAKMRTEFAMDGQSVVMLSDPKAKSQIILLPAEKTYMQMPIGEGPLSLPILGPADGGNPCWEGSTNSNCVKGKAESVNGYDAIRWEYNDINGTVTRAWVSTKLRFPLRVEGDDGSSMEVTGVAEGAQPAGLFGVPAGYKKMEIDDFPGFSHGGGLGGGLAAAMANIPPDVQAAMAAAGRGNTAAAMGPKESGWEKTKGWVINITVTGSGSSAGGNDMTTWKEAYSFKVGASVPLNFGTPSIGMAGAPGPLWMMMGSAKMGTPEALATPITFKVETVGRYDVTQKAACMVAQEASTSVGTIRTDVEKRLALTDPSHELGTVQGSFKISWDLKTYDVFATIGSLSIPESIVDVKVNAISCRDGKPYTKTEPPKGPGYRAYEIRLDYKGLPLPSTVGPVTGSQKARLTLGGRETDATINWTITPIR
jgi:hypothetical protein